MPEWLYNEWLEVLYTNDKNVGVKYGQFYMYEFKKEYIIERNLD